MRILAILSVLLYASVAKAAINSNYNNFDWNNDIDYYQETWLDANPDAVLTDWQWMLGGDPNNGDFTDDGFCFPFYNNGDPYIVYGANDPSSCSWWSDLNIYQGAEMISFFDANLIVKPGGIEYLEGEIYTTDDLFGDTSQYWDGCFNVVQGGQSWAGTSGGQCPNINDGYGGQINYGYVEQTLTNIAAINEALKGVGLETTGYTYSWFVKNADANYESTNNPNSVDPFEVTIRIIDNNNTVVYEKTYDYSYHIDNWQNFTGSEEFASPFDLDTLSEIELSITGQDIGGWAGYYGPEFRNPDVRLNYRVKVEEDTTTEDLIFAQMCDMDPLSDINCPGYNDAMLAQITAGAQIEEIVEETPIIVEEIAAIEEVANIVEPIAEEPIVEETVAAIEEQMVEEAAEVSEPEQKEESSSSSSGTGLSADQLMALDIASATTAAAEQTASGAAAASAGVGLSESGGVSAELTSDGLSVGGDFGSTGTGLGGAGSTQIGVDLALGGESQLGGSMASFDSNETSDGSNQSDSNSGDTGNIESDIAGFDLDINIDSTTQFSENESQDTIESFEMASLDLEMTTINNDIVNDIVNRVTNDLIMQANQLAEEVAEESAEESYEDQNAREDDLVAQALNGSDDEDAQAALLGYNPNFREYQQPQMADSEFYQPKDIYEEYKNYDNPNQRFFNGASDAIHRDMVRSQYD